MADVRNTPMLLHGIGKGFLKNVDGDVLELTTSQSMTINVTTSTEDVYGGDGLFPIFNYITNKEGSIEITDATFKLSQLNMAQRTVVKTAGNKKMVRYLIKSGDATLSTSTLSGFECAGIIAPDGSAVPSEIVTGTAGALCIDATGVVDWTDIASPMAGEYSVWGKVDDTEAIMATMLKDAVCAVAEFFWTFQTEDQSGKKYQVDIHAKRTRSSGEFNIETSRDSASTPSLSMKILDPGDGDSNFMDMTITPV